MYFWGSGFGLHQLGMFFVHSPCLGVLFVSSKGFLGHFARYLGLSCRFCDFSQ